MRLIIRVTATIVLSAFGLWAQASGDACGFFSSDDAIPKQVFQDSRFALKSANVQVPEVRFRLNTSFSSSENRGPAIGQYASTWHPVPMFETQAGSSRLPQSRPKAFNYSNAYLLRQKIHKYASIATLPLFVSEAVVGQKLFDKTGSESESLRSAHTGLATGIGVLFGVNSVTGVWNLWEARKNPNGRGKRMLHGILMLAADAGFVATAALAPHDDDGEEGVVEREGRGSASAHRAVAFSSLGVAAASYIYMLFAR